MTAAGFSVCLLAGPAAAQLREPALPKASARALYVSCYLLAQGADVPRPAPNLVSPFSAMTCALHAVHAAGLRDGRPDKPGGFCMGASSRPGPEMGEAYVAYLEAHPAEFAAPDAEPLFHSAMQARWPCAPR
jgi:hypothetical protein